MSLDEFASPQAMAQIDAGRLAAILSDDFDPAHSTVDRVEERLGQLHDVAAVLLEQYEGQAMNIYCQAGGRIQGEGGIFQRLAAIPAYTDPLDKKAQLLVGQLDAAGVWPLEDPENLKVCMDYHAMRVALRTGIVEVTDPGLFIALKQKARVSDDINHAVRRAVSDACDRVIAHSGVSVFEFDKWIWHLGRSCCFYDHEPICGPRTCHKMDICTYIKAVDYACPGKCSLDGACKGSRDDYYRAFWETNVYTEFYVCVLVGKRWKRYRCPFCGGRLREGKATVPFVLQDSVVVVKDVPATLAPIPRAIDDRSSDRRAHCPAQAAACGRF